MDPGTFSFTEVKTRAEFGRAYPLLSLLLKEEDPQAYAQLTEDVSFSNFEKAAQTGFRLLTAQTEDGVIVGTIGIRPFWDPLSIGMGFEINDLILTPSLRGKGTGRNLLSHAEDIVAAAGGTWARVLTSPEESETLRWYQSQGYALSCHSLLKDIN